MIRRDAMNRLRLPVLTRTRYRLAAVTACAAVLLTSFQDEALLAFTSVSFCDADEVASRPRYHDGISLFPDLSPPKTGDVEIEQLKPTVSFPVREVGLRVEPGPVRLAEGPRQPSLRTLRRRCLLHCTWLI